MSEPKSVLVTGATGKQGGALVRVLLNNGHRVSAVTRNVDSPQARELARRGSKLFAADADDIASIQRAARGIDIVFAMATPADGGVEAETRQGINIVNAAK